MRIYEEPFFTKNVADGIEHHGARAFAGCDDAAFAELVPGVDTEGFLDGAVFFRQAECRVLCKGFLSVFGKYQRMAKKSTP